MCVCSNYVPANNVFRDDLHMQTVQEELLQTITTYSLTLARIHLFET